MAHRNKNDFHWGFKGWSYKNIQIDEDAKILRGTNGERVRGFQFFWAGEGEAPLLYPDNQYSTSRFPTLEDAEQRGITTYNYNAIKGPLKGTLQNYTLFHLQSYILHNPERVDTIRKVVDAIGDEEVDLVFEHHKGNETDHPSEHNLENNYDTVSDTHFVEPADKVIKIVDWVSAGLEEKPTRSLDYLISRAFSNYENLATTSYFDAVPSFEVVDVLNEDYTRIRVTYTGPKGSDYVRKGVHTPGDELPTEPNSITTLEEDETVIALQNNVACMIFFREAVDDEWTAAWWAIPLQEEETEEQ